MSTPCIGLSPGLRREVTETREWFQGLDNFARVFAIRPGEKMLMPTDP